LECPHWGDASPYPLGVDTRIVFTVVVSFLIYTWWLCHINQSLTATTKPTTTAFTGLRDNGSGLKPGPTRPRKTRPDKTKMQPGPPALAGTGWYAFYALFRLDRRDR